MSRINRWICLVLIFPFITDSAVIPQTTGRSLGCSAVILRFSECSSRCNDSQTCMVQELSNFMTACMSGNTQNCTEPPLATRSQPEPSQTTLSTTEPPLTRISPTEPPQTTLPPPPENTISKVKCGIENQVRVERVINGTPVDVVRKYSWQVGWKQTNKEGIYSCGGSIITNRHILTAAHCFGSWSSEEGAKIIKIPDDVYIYIGDHNQHAASDNLPDFVEPIKKKYVNIHPDYNANDIEHGNDIAVIELEKPIDLEKYADDIHPVCLPEDDSKTYAGKTATVTGWGSTIGYDKPLPGTYGRPSSLANVLHETQLAVMKNSKCNKKTNFDIINTMICTATSDNLKTNRTGNCQGDSGGPLSVEEDIQHIQIGVVSFGQGCAAEESPNIYTRVSKFLNWIKMQVGNETTYTAN